VSVIAILQKQLAVSFLKIDLACDHRWGGTTQARESAGIVGEALGALEKSKGMHAMGSA
jgi:hypothetical protein